MKSLVSFIFALALPGSALAAPTILFSGTDVSEIYHYSSASVNFTLVAADNGKVESLAGAVLTDAVTGATYGGFSAGAQKGTYLLEVFWDHLLQVRPIEPSADRTETRTFRATVFNTAGQSTSVDFNVNIRDDNTLYEALPAGAINDITPEIMSLMKKRAYVGQNELTFEPYYTNGISYDAQNKSSTPHVHGHDGPSSPGPKLFQDVKSFVTKYNLPHEEKETSISFSFGIRCIERSNTWNCWTYLSR